jgi:hypothetical protein
VIFFLFFRRSRRFTRTYSRTQTSTLWTKRWRSVHKCNNFSTRCTQRIFIWNRTLGWT